MSMVNLSADCCQRTPSSPRAVVSFPARSSLRFVRLAWSFKSFCSCCAPASCASSPATRSITACNHIILYLLLSLILRTYFMYNDNLFYVQWYLVNDNTCSILPVATCHWQWNFIRDQPRIVATYLLWLPSLKAQTTMSAKGGNLFALHSRVQTQTFGFVLPSQVSCNRCNEPLGDASAVCVHCTVDCPKAWPKVDGFFEGFQCVIQ